MIDVPYFSRGDSISITACHLILGDVSRIIERILSALIFFSRVCLFAPPFLA